MKLKNVLFLLLLTTGVLAQPIIIDHTYTDITELPEEAILQAKETLHIAYGHTSHGSQLTTGMTGLVNFANGGGKGLSLPENIFAWNNGGTNGALDFHDGAMGGDVGYYPQWVDNTRNYLGTPNSEGMGSANPDVNVIMWSWCGQIEEKYENNTLYSEYFDPMCQLELDYYGVHFVYMTGHVDYWYHTINVLANKAVRNFCINNNKILYDFADIESYDPDGTYFEFANDNCDYYSYFGGSLLGNWALEWQNSHIENVDWYDCYSAHSQSLNANQKAYAAWWMFGILAGYDTSLPVTMTHFDAVYSGNDIKIQWKTSSEIDCYGFHIWRKSNNDFVRITDNIILGHGNTSTEHEYSFIDYSVNLNKYLYKIEEITINGESIFYETIVVEPTFVLKQNYPNPFNFSTQIPVYSPIKTNIKINIYDIAGRLIQIIKKDINKGLTNIYWEGTNVASGVYIYSIKINDEILNKKMTLIY